MLSKDVSEMCRDAAADKAGKKNGHGADCRVHWFNVTIRSYFDKKQNVYLD